MRNAEELSKDNGGITVSIALNYGGRQDILHAVRELAKFEDISKMDDEALQSSFEKRLMTQNLPEPDLLIRTSGEQRSSHFLLWQCAYSEFWFCETLWPDFGKTQLEEAIGVFNARERRFGGLKA